MFDHQPQAQVGSHRCGEGGLRFRRCASENLEAILFSGGWVTMGAGGQGVFSLEKERQTDSRLCV